MGTTKLILIAKEHILPTLKSQGAWTLVHAITANMLRWTICLVITLVLYGVACTSMLLTMMQLLLMMMALVNSQSILLLVMGTWMMMGLFLRQTYLYSCRPSGLPAKNTLSVNG
jgi:hypothetical protein